MASVPSAKDEPASSSHVEITTSLSCSTSYVQDVKMKRVDYNYIDPQLYEAGLYMNSVSGSQGWITQTSDMQEENYAYMDPILYKAAVDGDFQPFDAINDRLSLKITPDKNTVLHIYIRSQSEASQVTTRFIEQVLDKCPSLLLHANAMGDTPLHVAAKYGHDTVVKFLIDRAKIEEQRGLGDVKQMLRKTNDTGNTGLHEAVQHGYLRVVKILTEEDPDFSYSTNNLGETPLFIAVDKGCDDAELVDEILTNCRELAYEGPHGRTALHAAVMNNSGGVVEKLLLKKISLAKEVDRYGWTPLHYAAYYNHYEMVKKLLDYDIFAAYIGDKERKMTPLHLAAGRGLIDIMKEIISRCPTCYELLDIRGRNVLHYAILSLTWDGNERISQWLPDRKLMCQKDADGNTPLHLVSSLYPKRKNKTFTYCYYNWAPSPREMTNKQGLSVHQMYCDSQLHSKCQLEKEILELSETAHAPYQSGVITLPDEHEDDEDNKEEDLAEIERARESHLVVAALIATVTFAAAFTLPGGYIQDGPGQGTAILKRNSAFQAFVISNALAMVLSVSAVFVHFIMSLRIFRKYDFMFWYAFYFTLSAMGAMVIAFITGVYAVLAPSWLAILIIVIGLTFFSIVFYLFVRIIARVMKDALPPGWRIIILTIPIVACLGKIGLLIECLIVEPIKSLIVRPIKNLLADRRA